MTSRSSHPAPRTPRSTRTTRARRGALLASAALVASLAIAPLGAGAASAAPGTDGADARRWVQGDHTIPVFDVEQAITENVNVKTGMDGDENGVEDTIRVQVVRPDTSGTEKVPLIVHASPYYSKGSRSTWETNFFLPHGYAVATVALPGTDFSTGVEGLETIVPVAAISSWYDYTRGNGITYYDDHVGFLHEYVSNFDSAFCRTLTPILNTAADDATSSYNDWWAERDYRLQADNITASVFVVHGLTDENVKTGQFGYWWDELVENGIERKLFLHQSQHIDPVSFGATYTTPLLEWFDYYLQDLDNGAPDGPQAIIQRESGAWSTDEVWPPADTEVATMKLSKPLGRVGGLSTDGAGDTTQARTAKIVQSTAHSSDSIVANPTTPRSDRAVFLSSALEDGIREAGTAKVKLRVKVDKPLAGFQARVVDYTDTGASTIVSRTMASLNHHNGLDQYETLQPGKFYTLKWNIHTDDRIFAAGHRLGLVLTAEQQNIEGSYTPFTATIKLRKSSLKIPLTGAGVAPAGLDAVSPSVGTTIANILPAKSLDEFVREFLMEGTSS